MTTTIDRPIILDQPLPLDKNPAVIYVASLATKSGQHGQAGALRLIASIFHTDLEHMNWGALRYEHTIMIRSQLAQTYKPAHVNKCLAALKQTLTNAWRLGQMSAEDLARARDIPRMKGESLPAGRALTAGEIYALFVACQNDKNQSAGTRDAAIIAVLYTTGLRREECASLQLSDYDQQNKIIRVLGKGNIEENVPVIDDTEAVLLDWLQLRGIETGPLFTQLVKDGTVTSKKISAKAIYRMTEKRGRQAKIRNFTPHDLRRTFVTHMIDAGEDIGNASKAARHKQLQTTMRYNRQGEQVKRRAASRLHIPYVPRSQRESA